MIPKALGAALRRRRTQLDLRQADIVGALGDNPRTGKPYTRAYVSAVEAGTDWDPDATTLRRWSEALGWDRDYILNKLGRVEPERSFDIPPELRDAIRETIREELRAELHAALEEEAAKGGAARRPRHQPSEA